jgi:hypothetical protein
MWPLNIFFFFIILIAMNTGELLALIPSLAVYMVLMTIWETQIKDK